MCCDLLLQGKYTYMYIHDIINAMNIFVLTVLFVEQINQITMAWPFLCTYSNMYGKVDVDIRKGVGQQQRHLFVPKSS